MDLTQIAIMLTALVVAATLARALGMAAVLGYLGAGVLLGPFGLGQVFNAHDAKELREVADFGVVMLLFLIGLELRPKRLWAMRQAIFGLGAVQVFLTAFVLALIGIALGSSWKPALFAGSALALSSTAFALQVMEENGELATRHGRLGFAVLLFQDIAAIPLIALTPFFALSASRTLLSDSSSPRNGSASFAPSRNSDSRQPTSIIIAIMASSSVYSETFSPRTACAKSTM